MKRIFCIFVLATVMIAMTASPLFSAKKKGSSESSATPAARTAESSKAVQPQEKDRKTTIPSTTTTGSIKRTIRQPDFEMHTPLNPTPEPQRSSAQTLQIDWISINHGGAIEVASGNLKMGLSIAQPVAGEVSSENLKMGLGFWYGTGGCLCPLQADLDGDGYATALDLGLLADILFIGAPDPPNPGCPISRADFDNDGYPTALDIAWMADYLFIGGSEPCNPCDPVQASCAQ